MILPDITHVLFDLDGTLIDTAPDLLYALNLLRDEQGYPPVEYSKIRPVVSLGGAAMICTAFDIGTDNAAFTGLRDRFLQIYGENIYRMSRLFDGMEDVLSAFNKQNIGWGIVTNKPGWLTKPLLEAMNLHKLTECVVSGDTLAYAKPRPEPLFHACKILNCLPESTIYIGDAQRDIEAGIRAGMPTMIAKYGYIEDGAILDEWGAHTMIEKPHEILTQLRLLDV